MKLIVRSLGDTEGAIIQVDSDTLDAGNSQQFKDQMAPHLKANSLVVLDLGGLKFVDSSGLGALLSCLRLMNNQSHQLKLIQLSESVRALFELVRMHRVFSIYNDLDEATASL